jgi:hypothetical protein
VSCPTIRIIIFANVDRRETERDWDIELADDVRGECQDKYGKVIDLKVEKESEVSSPSTIHAR